MMFPAAKQLFSLRFPAAVADRFHRRLSEWHIAGVTLVVGVMLALSNTFALPPYEIIRTIAVQETWALIMIALGTGRIAALIVNGSWPRATAHVRYLLASVSAFVWALLLAGFLAFDTPLMLGPFIGAAAIVDLVTAFRAAQDAREADAVGGGNGPG